jgi:hypothetical protein
MAEYKIDKQETFQYYTHKEAELFSYYTIPKELFTNSRYKHISTDAKLLYGLLRDRNQLSIKNNWIDEEGHIYIIFTRDEAMEILSVAKEKVTKIFKELSEVGLIKDKRQGFNQANITYVGKIIAENVDNSKKFENRTSVSSKNTLPEVRKSNSNKTDINNTDFSNKSVSQLSLVKNSQEKDQDRQTDEETIDKILKESQAHLYPEETNKLIKESVRTVFFIPDIAYKLRMGLTHEQLKDRLRGLRLPHIDRACKRYEEHKDNVKNTLVYFTKTLIESIAVAGAEEMSYKGVEDNVN